MKKLKLTAAPHQRQRSVPLKQRVIGDGTYDDFKRCVLDVCPCINIEEWLAEDDAAVAAMDGAAEYNIALALYTSYPDGVPRSVWKSVLTDDDLFNYGIQDQYGVHEMRARYGLNPILQAPLYRLFFRRYWHLLQNRNCDGRSVIHAYRREAAALLIAMPKPQRDELLRDLWWEAQMPDGYDNYNVNGPDRLRIIAAYLQATFTTVEDFGGTDPRQLLLAANVQQPD